MFHLFVGSNYYPQPGLRDHRGSYETLDEAKSAVSPSVYDDWYSIIGVDSDGNLYEAERGRI